MRLPPRADPRRCLLLIAFAALMVAPPPLVAAAFAAVVVAGAATRLARAARRDGVGEDRPAAATLLGTEPKGTPVLLDDSQLGAHGLILGASGAGKSTTLLAILAGSIARGSPVVALDLKGSPAFAGALAAAAGAAGRTLRVWTPDGPTHWNPLAHGNATELKDKLIATERFTEPHYQRAAERYVQLALQLLREARPGADPTLADVVQAMEPRRLAGLVRSLEAARAAAVGDYLAALSSDQLSAIRGLAARLAILSESDSGRFLGPAPAGGGAAATSLDLRAALDQQAVVLFSLNSSRYGKLAAQIGTLAIQDLVAAVGDRLSSDPARRRPLAVIGIDEFSALGADNVIALLARGRESRVSVMLATQELADLDRAAAGLRDQVLGNTAIKIAHRQDVPASAQTIAQLAGTVERWEESRHYGGGLLGGYDTGRGTRRRVERYRVHPNEVKELCTGEAVVIVKQPRAAVRRIRVSPARSGPVLG